MKTAAQTFRANPNFDVETAITELGVGEALISCLDENGTPQIVERGWVMPPASAFSAISPDERSALMANSIVAGVYDDMVDRDSAYEMLSRKVDEIAAQAEAAEAEAAAAKEAEILAKQQAKEQAAAEKAAVREAERKAKQKEELVQTAAKTAIRALGSSTGKSIVRGLLGSIFGGRR